MKYRRVEQQEASTQNVLRHMLHMVLGLLLNIRFNEMAKNKTLPVQLSQV